MNTELTTAIRKAQTQTQLDCAMDKYLQQLGADFPELRSNYALDVALRRHQYFRAINLVPCSGYKESKFHAVVVVLKQAADKQFSLARGPLISDAPRA